MNITLSQRQIALALMIVLVVCLIIGTLILPSAHHLAVHVLAAGSTSPNVIVHNG